MSARLTEPLAGSVLSSTWQPEMKLGSAEAPLLTMHCPAVPVPVLACALAPWLIGIVCVAGETTPVPPLAATTGTVRAIEPAPTMGPGVAVMPVPAATDVTVPVPDAVVHDGFAAGPPEVSSCPLLPGARAVQPLALR